MNEHFTNELRSCLLNQPDFDAATLMTLIRRLHHELSLCADPDVHLPHTCSSKGYNRAVYEGATAEQFVHESYPTEAEVRQIYWRCVAALRPLFTALGCAAALRRAGQWEAPPLEVWPAIEAALAAEAAAEAEAEAQLNEQADLFDHAEPGDAAGGLADEPPPPPAPPEAPPAAGPAAAPEYFPERIVAAWQPKGGGARAVERRQLLVKWHYWRDTDLTWELQSKLIADGHGGMVRTFLLDQTPPLKLPAVLLAAAAAAEAAAAAPAEEWLTSGSEWLGRRTRTFHHMEADCLVADGTVVAWMCETSTVAALWRVEHDDGDTEELELHELCEALTAFDEGRLPSGYGPPLQAASAADVLPMLTSALGSEAPNLHVRDVHLPASASAAQRAEWEYTHVLNPETGQYVHKKAALAFEQSAYADRTPGAGRERYASATPPSSPPFAVPPP